MSRVFFKNFSLSIGKSKAENQLVLKKNLLITNEIFTEIEFKTIFRKTKRSPVKYCLYGANSVGNKFCKHVASVRVYVHLHPTALPPPSSKFQKLYSGFSQTRKIDIIANFVLPYICSSHLYLHHVLLVDVKLDVSGYKLQIIFQSCIVHCSSFFFSNGTAKTILAFLYCGEFVKNCSVDHQKLELLETKSFDLLFLSLFLKKKTD